MKKYKYVNLDNQKPINKSNKLYLNNTKKEKDKSISLEAEFWKEFYIIHDVLKKAKNIKYR